MQTEKISNTLVNYISELEYPEILLNENEWPNTFEKVLCGDSVCNVCETSVSANISCDISLSHYVLVEFSSTLSNRCKFLEQVSIKGCTYQLCGLVRGTGAHFSCALFSENIWFYFDDLKEDRIQYNNLIEL